MKDSESPEKFKKEVEKCVLLGEEEKQYWLQNADTLPRTLLDTMYAFFKEKNQLVDSYVTKAIEEDPNVVSELKEKVQAMKKHVLKYKEAEEKGGEKAEQMLQKEIEKL